jgi:hypothetical protein
MMNRFLILSILIMSGCSSNEQDQKINPADVPAQSQNIVPAEVPTSIKLCKDKQLSPNKKGKCPEDYSKFQMEGFLQYTEDNK